MTDRKEGDFGIWKSRAYNLQQSKTRAPVKLKRSVKWLSRLQHPMTCKVGELTASQALKYGGRRSITRDKTSHGDPCSECSPYHLDLSFYTWKHVFWLGNKEQ